MGADTPNAVLADAIGRMGLDEQQAGSLQAAAAKLPPGQAAEALGGLVSVAGSAADLVRRFCPGAEQPQSEE